MVRQNSAKSKRKRIAAPDLLRLRECFVSLSLMCVKYTAIVAIIILTPLNALGWMSFELMLRIVGVGFSGIGVFLGLSCVVNLVWNVRRSDDTTSRKTLIAGRVFIGDLLLIAVSCAFVVTGVMALCGLM